MFYFQFWCSGFIFVFHERTQELSRTPINIEFKYENPTNKDIDIIYVALQWPLPTPRRPGVLLLLEFEL